MPTCSHSNAAARVPEQLQSSSYVFVRGATKKALETPYDGPYKVLQSGPKYFVLEIGGSKQTVTVDRLKPAHLDPQQEVVVAVPPRRGRPPNTFQT